MSKKKKLCTLCGYSEISCRCGKPKKPSLPVREQLGPKRYEEKVDIIEALCIIGVHKDELGCGDGFNWVAQCDYSKFSTAKAAAQYQSDWVSRRLARLEELLE